MSEASEGEWLVPFRGRNHSGAFTQNFLWKRQNVYVMDNHRAALWCWLQHIDPKQPYSLFHMDQHYDTLASRMTTWLDNLPPDWALGIDEYLERKVKYQDIPQPLLCSAGTIIYPFSWPCSETRWTPPTSRLMVRARRQNAPI